jgi:predicted phage gp36 major capsid-like protein
MMADYDLPPDLLQMRRDFLAAERRLSELGRAMPSEAAVRAQEAEPPTEEQRRAWAAAQDECRRLAVQIQTHPWWATVDSRQAAERALRDAAAERDDLDEVS